MTDEDEAAIVRTVARLARIDATFVGWSERMDARLVLIKEDPHIFAQAARRYRTPDFDGLG